jgi:CRP-like cAMP-binding protein
MRIFDHPAFKGVDLNRVAPMLDTIRPQTVTRGTLVARPDLRCCILVLEGSVQTYVIAPSGRRLLFEIIGAGGVDGLLNIETGIGGHFAEVRCPSVVAVLSRRVVDDLIEADTAFAVNLLQLATDRIGRRERQLEAATHHEAIRRVAAMLLSLYPGPPGKSFGQVELHPRPSHQMLADMVGLRRETMTMHLGLLRDMSAVRVRRDHLLLDRALLEKVVEGTIGGQMHRRRIRFGIVG